ncbi:MAG: magnesium transporter, partial [Bacilli bacterium]|nr:magnesium transporter [Bacilli bacterium]
MEEEKENLPVSDEERDFEAENAALLGDQEPIEDEETGVDVEKTSEEELAALIDAKDAKGLLAVFDKVPTIDIAEAANDLPPSSLIFIFRNVESSYTADFFEDLSQDTKESLIKAMTNKDLVELINAQAADDIADTYGDLPANLANKVLRAADKDMRKALNTLLKYKEDTAGSLMTTEYIE